MVAPPSDYTTVFDGVALLTSGVVQAAETSPTEPHRLFAKTGLVVRAGREVTLSVGPEAAIFWGNRAAVWTRTLLVPACPQPPGAKGPWLAYPGGYAVDTPTCLPLRVTVGTRSKTLRVPAGKPC
ncbi:hypothetical protein [Cryptosporangium phraense]|uniref:Uncharacterized protein n=1 Tax=Cryptosporangium phraense TaxID=2593070 RepID=A0A545ALF3_9ACTN|nr:hypothetical protein [Cryptosporangium phraense]TQS42132.1 hypothetical protein FL583_26460 [Cryptosporangium phraense]